MPELILPARSQGAVPIYPVVASRWRGVAARQPAFARQAAAAAKFTGAAGEVVVVADTDGGTERVLFGLGDPATVDLGIFRQLSGRLGPGDYRFTGPLLGFDPDQVALAWSLGAYRFDRYKAKPGLAAPRLAAPRGCDIGWARAAAQACASTRDMINTPANDLGPQEVETIIRDVAATCGARVIVAVGEALLTAGYPAVHAVGKAAGAGREPRMIELAWGRAGDPLVALVGKGVVFDSGGLDIKPSAGMRNMKKDMGGAAHVLALARMVIAAGLRVRLAVLLPVVENAISGPAMRPGDVLASRSGLTIEVGNTDAEGRLILADALTRAIELDPVLTIDMATLTGAARVALGPQVVPFFTADDALASDLAARSAEVGDPLWRMPLWAPYAASLESDIADIRNDADPWSQAGCITAALFLQRFAPATPWAHFDIYAWNPRVRPGFGAGAEIQAIRAIFAVLRARFG